MFKCNYGFVTSSVIFMAEINANTYLIFRRTCCRISEQVNEYLPGEGTTYRVHHPMLGRVSFYETRGTDKLSPYSINWCAEDSKIEVIDGKTGKATAPLSRTVSSVRVTAPPSRVVSASATPSTAHPLSVHWRLCRCC